MKRDRASPETIRKLAAGFGGDGTNERLALEDHLLMLGGHRTPHQGEGSSYLKIIPLLTGEHQHILEALVIELAKIEGIEIPPGVSEAEALGLVIKSSDQVVAATLNEEQEPGDKRKD
ncbi:hypothetical protein ES703_125924 [subsurface metagenome]